MPGTPTRSSTRRARRWRAPGRARGTIVGRNALSAASKKVVSTAVSSATMSSSGSDSQPPMAASGMRPRSSARPRSAPTSTGRRRSRSTQAPATSPTARPATRSMLRTSGDADRVGVERDDRHERQCHARDQRAEDRDRGGGPHALKRALRHSDGPGSSSGGGKSGSCSGSAIGGQRGQEPCPACSVPRPELFARRLNG